MTSDCGCFRCWPKSDQLVYGASEASLVLALISRRTSFSGGMPSLRARAMLIAGRSSGRPSRLLRSVSVTNSSISLPVWSDEPITIGADRLPRRVRRAIRVPGSRVDRRVSKNSGGFRNAVSSGSELSFSVVEPSALWMLVRATVSSSIEWPKRYTAWANSASIAGFTSVAYTWNGRIAGTTLRANSSNTRCWYSISVTNRAAWNRRPP